MNGLPIILTAKPPSDRDGEGPKKNENVLPPETDTDDDLPKKKRKMKKRVLPPEINTDDAPRSRADVPETSNAAFLTQHAAPRPRRT